MKAPLSWLREYVSTDATDMEIAQRLTISSLEVDRLVDVGVADAGGNLTHFVVGRVISADPHPNADRLQLCQVDVGNPDPQQIVCGAWNFGAGATVAVGLPGALLPGFPGPLEERPLRGEVSRGMILAEDEIGLGTDHAGIMLLPDGLEPGTPLRDVLPLVDRVLDVTPTMNRPDLLSLVGIAREIAALCGGELHPPEPDDPPPVAHEPLDIRVEDFAGCPRYIGRAFRNVRVGPSPQWLRSRLHLAGMRSISNVVDVTNYVMHVWGSPLHAFDRALLAGGRIVVRRARDGETLRTLDGTLRELLPSDLLITDGERPVALAAIMGGLESEVSESTTGLLLEAANFEPIGVLRTSERLGLRTEGSNKWEKGVDPYAAEPAAVLASRLLADVAAAEPIAAVDVNDGLPERPLVTLRTERASRLIGLDVATGEQRSILERLGFEVDRAWAVTVPTWRARDVTREVDLVEEVARVVLDRVPHTMPLRRFVAGHLTAEQRFRRALEDVLVGAGYSEAYTWSLTASDPDPAALRLPDPMSGDQAVLRTTLLHGLLEAARVNVDAGNESIRLFELARVYLPSGEQLPDERWHVGGIAEGGFGDRELVVVGGGDTAMEEATFLTKFASKVTIVHRRDQFRASKVMQDRVFAHPKIEVVWDSVLDEIVGEQAVTGVTVRNVKTGETMSMPTDGVFMAIGHDPSTSLFHGQLDTDGEGYLVVGEPSTETNVHGVFAAGDVTDHTYRQAVTAAGQGCKAAIDAERLLGEEQHGL